MNPETFNRLENTSLKELYDFVHWLTETTVSDLSGCRGDLAATKSAFIRYFRRGLKASLLLQELADNLPAIMARTDYTASDAAGVIAMLKALNLDELTIRPPTESSSASVV